MGLYSNSKGPVQVVVPVGIGSRKFAGSTAQLKSHQVNTPLRGYTTIPSIRASRGKPGNNRRSNIKRQGHLKSRQQHHLHIKIAKILAWSISDLSLPKVGRYVVYVLAKSSTTPFPYHSQQKDECQYTYTRITKSRTTSLH